MTDKVKVAILGSGNIGTDLLVKVMRSDYLQCGAFIGRSSASLGIKKAISMNAPVSVESIEYIKKNPDCSEIVFDATSASGHEEHAPVLKNLGKFVIDLTPAGIGTMCVPAINMEECLSNDNVNLVTCGGQASIPVIYAIGKTQKDVDYMEVVSSIASRSAGPATRLNLDEYIHTTERGIKKFSNPKHCKAILNLNPANPCINMQTTIMAKVNNPCINTLAPELDKLIKIIKAYVPGYEIIVGPIIDDGKIVVSLKVIGLGDYLPRYAGNLDIINCAAIAMAELYSKNIIAH